MNILTPHQSKALSINKSISLTANAGSGKTFVLAQRFLEIIIKTSTPLSQVAAITFTEKAAGELYKRISEELNKLLIVTTDSDLKHHIEKIRKRLVSVKISTIHSFCIDLLREFPVEASIDANFIPIDEQKASELIDLAIETKLKEMLKSTNDQSDVKLLIRLLGSKNNLVSELSEMISKKKNVLHLIDKNYSLSENEIAKNLFRLFKSNLKIVLEKVLPEVLTQLEIINNKVFDYNLNNKLAIETKHCLESIRAEENEIDVFRKLQELRGKILIKDGSVRKQGYLPSKEQSEIQSLIENVENFFSDLDEIELADNHNAMEIELAKYGMALIRIFRDVLAAFEFKKSEIGVLDFEDILLKTKMLFENESVRKALSGKYKFLLVDEYQDTNQIQYEIFLPLVDDLKKGNLFIVGDEKQSIYRFRDAELQVFSKTKSDIQEAYGNDSLLTLPDSFRMAPSICLFVNSLFENLFTEPRLFFNEVSASDLVCARSDGFEGHVEFLIAADEDASTDTNEAELIAKRIIKLKQEQKSRLSYWNEIAILVRKRAAFAELQNAFIKFQIPFKVVGGTGFYQKQSISDIYNYFAFLLNEKDDAALIGVLRSPFFLVSDVNLLELSMFEGESFWEKIKKASASQIKFWAEKFQILNENKELSSRINISLLLRKILKESDFISTISSRIDGAQEISNLNKLISITNEFFNDEFNTLYDYASFLNEAISRSEDEAQGHIEATNDGVHILTIHQAKGLEYPAVFLFKCNDTTQVNKVKSRSFTVDKIFGLLTKVPLNENYFGDYFSAPIVGVYNYIESNKEIAELKRLLYVGLTRAKDFLFISYTDEGKSLKKKSFAALINEGLQQKLTSDKVMFEGELIFLHKENETYTNLTKSLKTEIPVLRHIEYSEQIIKKDNPDIKNKKLILSGIKDESKGEVISATRFSTFSTCPLKYNLQYNYKLGELIQQSYQYKRTLKFNFEDDYNRRELSSHLFDDDSTITEFVKFKGQLIHYILRKNISKENLSEFVEEKLKNNFNEAILESLRPEIMNDLICFYDSNEFKSIDSFINYKNEFEAYLKVEDFYLFGIIDKIIIGDSKLIIIDYKTDNINPDQIHLSSQKYLPQLNFYAYIISRLFNKKFEIEGRIIFIKYPDNPFIFNFNETMDQHINFGIKSMIHSIRNNNYSVNLEACKSCIFADENKRCIKSRMMEKLN